MNKYLEKIASTEDLVNAGFGAGLGYGSEVLALKNPNNKFLKSLTFGHKGMGAAVGAASNVIAGRVVKGFMNKQASDVEYSGPSNWQTAGIVGAGVLGSAALGARAVHVLDKTLKPHGLGKVNLAELRNIHWRDAESLHPDVQSALKSLERSTAIAGVPAAIGAASVPVVALHRQYQDYKSGNKDPHYGRGALLGTIAGTTALNTPIGLVGGAALGLGAVGLNHLHNKYMNKVAATQEELNRNPAFQKMKAQRDSAIAARATATPSAVEELTPKGTNLKADYRAIIQQQNQDRVREELARQQQAKIDNRPMNRQSTRQLSARRDAEFELRNSKSPAPATQTPNDASGRDVRGGRQLMKNRVRAEVPVTNSFSPTSTHATGPGYGLPQTGYSQAPSAGTHATANFAPAAAAATAEDTTSRVAKMLSKYRKPAIALGALGIGGYALSGRKPDNE